MDDSEMSDGSSFDSRVEDYYDSDNPPAHTHGYNHGSAPAPTGERVRAVRRGGPIPLHGPYSSARRRGGCGPAGAGLGASLPRNPGGAQIPATPRCALCVHVWWVPAQLDGVHSLVVLCVIL